MFRIAFFRRKMEDLGLQNSNLYDENTFYDRFASDLRSATKSIVIESPYLTEKRIQQFAELLQRKSKNGVKIHIYTRNPAHHSKTLEIQAWKSLKILRAAGVRVFACDDMRHRKLAIIDGEILREGSLNIFSQRKSKELMRRTCSVDQCKMVKRFIRLGCRLY